MRKGEDDYTVVQADTSFLKKTVGFEPEYSFGRGLQKTIEYYRGKYVS